MRRRVGRGGVAAFLDLELQHELVSDKIGELQLPSVASLASCHLLPE